MIDPEIGDFKKKIDRYVIIKLRKIDDFYDLMKNNGGIHPIELMKSITRLYNSKKIHKTKFHRLKESAKDKGKISAEDMPDYLPVPHLVDYDWRFSQKGINYLAGVLRRSIRGEDATVVFIGTPSLFKFCITALRENVKLVLIDKNASKHGQTVGNDRIQFINTDINSNYDILSKINADYIIMDPPWYYNYYEMFFNRASLMIHARSCVICVMPPDFTRASARSERIKLIEQLRNNYGLEKVHYYHGCISYHTPPYERNVLKIYGINCLPRNWRIGDLLIVQKTSSGILTNPWEYAVNEQKWDEVSIGPVRIKIKHESDCIKNLDITLERIYPKDIYPSVKRSSRIQNANNINVWTSGNRVFRCSNTALLFFALIHRKENLTLLLYNKNITPTEDEISHITEIVKQIEIIASIEFKEYGYIWRYNK